MTVIWACVFIAAAPACSRLDSLIRRVVPGLQLHADRMPLAGDLDLPAARGEPRGVDAVCVMHVPHAERLADAMAECAGLDRADDSPVAHDRLLVIEQRRGL